MVHDNAKIDAWVKELTAKGIKCTINPATEPYSDSQFGFSLGNGVWHWFSFDNEYVTFYHTYSQNNGKSQRGVSHRLEVYARIERLTGIPFYD